MIKSVFFLSLFLGAALLNAANLSIEKIKNDQEKNRKKLFSFDPARNSWKAQKIAVDGKPPVFIDDYAERMYGKKWDFTSGTLDGIKGAVNVKDLKLKGSILTFTTEGDSEIFWGDHHKNNPEYGEEGIGSHWSGHWAPIRLKIRMKQSLEKSDWIASMRWFGGILRWGPKKKFTLKGTDWQDVDIQLMDSRFTFVSLGLKTMQPGNNVEIDSVSVYTPRTVRCFKKELDIKDEPVDAAFCINTAPVYKVYINGICVVREEQGSGMKDLLNRYENMARYFHKGKNIIIVEAERNNWFGPVDSLIMEGMVRDKAGDCYRLQTDKSWLGAYKDLDLKKEKDIWKPVKTLGKVNARFGYDGHGYFLNPPYYGRISIKPAAKKNFIFRNTEPAEMELKIYGKGIKNNFDIDYEIKDSLNGDAKIKEGRIASTVKPGVFSDKFVCRFPQPGVYDINIFIKDSRDGKIIDSRIIETAVVGKIKQEEIAGKTFDEGLDLKLLETINCTDENDKNPFVSVSRGKNIPAPIKTKSFGKYRETGSFYYDFISWKFEVKNIGKPHLIEIDYPDDADRAIAVSVTENTCYNYICNDRGERGWPCVASGVYTGFEYPVSNKMKTLRMVYYPSMKVETINIATARAGIPAAVSKVRIYEIKNDLPALKVASKKFRLTGIHTERISQLPFTFYTGESDCLFKAQMALYPYRGFYKAWYITTRNLIKYMRFCGENMLIGGVYMYNRGEYPSKNLNNYKQNFWAQADAASLIGEMFACNDMNLLLGVEYACPMELQQKDQCIDKQVAEGKYTRRGVDKFGKQIEVCSRLRNTFEPEVEKGLYEVVNELCKLYKNNPGIKGMAFQEGNIFGPSIPVGRHENDLMNASYDDVTIKLFEKDTGIKIPADKTGAKRFMQRYEWLKKNAWKKWMDWRCQKVYRINRNIADIIKKANPSWIMHIFFNQKVNSMFDQGLSEKYYQKTTGFYPPMYKDPVFCVSRYFWHCIRKQIGEPDSYIKLRAWTTDPKVDSIFTDGMKRTGVQIMNQFIEPSLKPRNWYWDYVLMAAYFLPVDENILESYNETLMLSTPYIIAQFWTDMAFYNGNEQYRRLFNRAFSVIPEGNYKTLTGNGLDCNIVIRSNGKAFYALNPLNCELDVKLSFKETSMLEDLATGRKYNASGNNVSFKMPPYGLMTFMPDKAPPAAAKIGISSQILEDCKSRCQGLTDLKNLISKKLKKRTIPEKNISAAEKFVSLLDDAEKYLDKGNAGKARLILDGFMLKYCYGQVKDLAAPVCWMVIGPFDNYNRKGFDIEYQPEKDSLNQIRKASYKNSEGQRLEWQKVTGKTIGKNRGIVDFLELYGKKSNGKLAYAWTYVKSDKNRDVKLLVGSDDGIKIWINGKQVFSHLIKRGLTPAEETVDAKLKKGWNSILLKVENDVGGWAFSFDIKDKDGNPIDALEYWPLRK